MGVVYVVDKIVISVFKFLKLTVKEGRKYFYNRYRKKSIKIKTTVNYFDEMLLYLGH